LRHFSSIAVVCASIAIGGSAGAAGPTKDLGFNVHQSPTVGLAATRDAGLRWVRIDLNWLDAEPVAQGQYDWSRFDVQIDAAKAAGLSVLAVVGYSPAWASQGDTKGGGSTNDVPRAGTFAPFVAAVVNRYKDRVTHYEIWNEPNLEQFFEGTPQDYIDRVLVPGADAVHAACATCKVLGPGLATVGSAYATWFDAVLASPAGAKIDILSGHVYAGFPNGSGTGPGVTSDSFYNKLESHRVLKAGNGIVIYEGPLSFKEVMDKRGAKQPFWITETGKESPLGDAAKEEAQRVYYRQVLELMLNRPWWTGTIFYEAFDEPPASYQWGAVVHDESAAKKYVPKAVHAFLAKVTSAQPAFGGTKTDCDDGLDNDLDGKIDYPDDTTCASRSAASEGVAPPPADGGSVVGPDAGVGDDASTAGGSPAAGLRARRAVAAAAGVARPAQPARTCRRPSSRGRRRWRSSRSSGCAGGADGPGLRACELCEHRACGRIHRVDARDRDEIRVRGGQERRAHGARRRDRRMTERSRGAQEARLGRAGHELARAVERGALARRADTVDERTALEPLRAAAQLREAERDRQDVASRRRDGVGSNLELHAAFARRRRPPRRRRRHRLCRLDSLLAASHDRGFVDGADPDARGARSSGWQAR
jgi:hypothetical protein